MLNTLVMHRVVDGEPREWIDISLPMLRNILDRLIIRQIPVQTAGEWQGGRAVCLSFDDGACSDHEIVFPELVARGMRATFFIVPEWVGKPGYMNWEQIRQLHAAGMEIGSHGLSHVHLCRLSKEQIWREFAESKRRIEDRLAAPVSTFAYPFGDCSAQCHDLGLRAGYMRLCTSQPGVPKSQHSILPRISVHRHHTEADIARLVEPGAGYLYWLKFFGQSRAVVKAMVGRKLYISVRNVLFR